VTLSLDIGSVAYLDENGCFHKAITVVFNNPIILAGKGSLWTVVDDDPLERILRFVSNPKSYYVSNFRSYEQEGNSAHYARYGDTLLFLGDVFETEKDRFLKMLLTLNEEKTSYVLWGNEIECCKYLMPL